MLARIVAAGLDNFDYNNFAQVSEACRFANATGALPTTRPGAIPAMPSI
ncbi:MAG: hypothetical protein HXX08_22380 [Chloroflexi bacterium]|uniref:Uncharacterized protein n=1 Tax=Candidatus Chlorohelix allophototropha TaxID=3003348 RepID=A0A8T7M9B1_9CHLR|nr:hypothetical protein [Chloroflexota bacterium]WJW68546.1 hypothetical protein OZ401_004160 [Chloroflexota bacterium L227-S17]